MKFATKNTLINLSLFVDYWNWLKIVDHSHQLMTNVNWIQMPQTKLLHSLHVAQSSNVKLVLNQNTQRSKKKRKTKFNSTSHTINNFHLNASKHLKNRQDDNVSPLFFTHSLSHTFLLSPPTFFYYFNDSIYCQFPLSLVFNFSAFLSQKCDKILVKKKYRNKTNKQISFFLERRI